MKKNINSVFYRQYKILSFLLDIIPILRYCLIGLVVKLNVHTISPHKIIFSKYRYNFLVLHYDDYHESNNLYLIPNEKEPFTIGSMKKYVRQYF